MDGFNNPKIEKQSIYEIYRACRLCGAGAGYKMPIIQNVVDLDSGEVELKQKVRECVQIEVHQDDKMPPLICELCVDKVNDFYEFLEMCRQTNKQTRLRLGLPPQTLPRGAPDAGDCILGVTEPIFLNNEESNEPLARSKSRALKPDKAKKEHERDSRDSKTKPVQKKAIKKEEPERRSSSSSSDRIESRTLRRSHARPPPRSLRGTKRSHDDDPVLSTLQKTRKSDEPAPKSVLKRERESKSEERVKVTRSRDKENGKNAVDSAKSKKVVKIMVKQEDFRSLPNVRNPAPHTRTPLNIYKCKVCKITYNNVKSLNNHARVHMRQKPAERKPSPPPPPRHEPKKFECKECLRQFADRDLMQIHRCSGRPSKAKPPPVEPEKPAAASVKKPTPKPVPKPAPKLAPKPAPKTPIKPQRVPPMKKKSTPAVIDPELLKQLQPLQVRISRCDPLLERKLGDHYDASDVDYDYGLDRACVYPYIYTFRHLRIKSEPLYMVNIQDDIKKAIDKDGNYVHWDSDETDSDLDLSDSKTVDTLTSISLKTIFSKKLIGKVPKKRKKVRVDKAFDSILNSSTDFDSDMRLGIDNIINSLDDDKDKSILDDSKDENKNDDNDSLFGDDNSPAIAVTNHDFDSLFSSDAGRNNDKSETSNTTNFSMDFTEDSDNVRSDKDIINKVQNTDSVENKELNKSDDSFNANDDSDKNIEGETNVKNDSKDDSRCNTDDISNVATDVKNSTDNISTDDKENSNANSLVNEDTDAKENETETNNKTDSSEAKDGSKSNKDIEESRQDGNHLNGQADEAFNMDDLDDVSDLELDDGATKDQDAKANSKTGVSENDSVIASEVPVSVKSADLESISDGEFD